MSSANIKGIVQKDIRKVIDIHNKWFYRVSKKSSVKADLAIYIIYRHVVDASGQCMSVSISLVNNIMDSFCKSSHSFSNI